MTLACRGICSQGLWLFGPYIVSPKWSMGSLKWKLDLILSMLHQCPSVSSRDKYIWWRLSLRCCMAFLSLMTLTSLTNGGMTLHNTYVTSWATSLHYWQNGLSSPSVSLFFISKLQQLWLPLCCWYASLLLLCREVLFPASQLPVPREILSPGRSPITQGSFLHHCENKPSCLAYSHRLVGKYSSFVKI